MGEAEKAELRQLVIDALQEGFNNDELHKTIYGLTPPTHFEAHKRINLFFEALDDTTKIARNVLIKIIVTILAGATVLGMMFNADSIITKIKG